jgi:hypothetical protein
VERHKPNESALITDTLPIGQALWLKELESYTPFPPLQNPPSYNLEQVLQQVKEMKATSSLRLGELHQLLDRHRNDIG